MKKNYLSFIFILFIATGVYSQKKVILENFTTAVCPNCPPIHSLLENYVSSQPNAILIAQHAGYYTDDMTVPENTQLLALYNDGGSTYAPGLAIDRHHYTTGLTGGTADPGPVFWPGESSQLTIQRINQKLTEPSQVSINLNGSVTGNLLSLDISGEILSDISALDLRLVVYIIEDGLVYYQSGAGSGYIHNNVMRDAISGTWGDPGVFSSYTTGTTYAKHYDYTLNANWDVNNLEVVAFIANFNVSNVNSREVINANSETLTDLDTVGIDDVALNEVKMYPNPAKNELNFMNVQNMKIEIYDIMGRLLLTKNMENQSLSIDVSTLQTGSYIVKMSLNNRFKVEKLIIA